MRIHNMDPRGRQYDRDPYQDSNAKPLLVLVGGLLTAVVLGFIVWAM